jgi:hypothetical protein
MALAVGALQVLSHIGGGKVLFGNAKIFGIAIEGYTVWTTFMTAGTVSGLLINTLAGLMAWGLLELGASIYGGKGLRWSWSEKGNGRLGFYTVEVLPTLTMETFGNKITSTIKGLKDFVVNLYHSVFSKEIVA